MDLWIRSQNGEVLTKCHCLGLEEQSGSKWSVLNYNGLEFYQYLGTYDYERALEVLDEINRHIEELYFANMVLNMIYHNLLMKCRKNR